MKRLIGLAFVLATACGRPDATAPGTDAVAPPPDSATQLAIEGRVNATPSIASDGTAVAVAWGAASGDRTGVFVATSRDAGATFDAPVLVNAAETARLGGEFPPRVAIRGNDVTVVWTARASHDAPTTIEVAHSIDGGRTFGDARPLQARSAAGARGWPALALARDGAAHAVWLDHRGLAAQAAGHHHGGTASAVDGVAQAQKSAIYYAAAGTSATPEVAIAPGVCYCCKTALATGTQGEVYAAWRHVYPGNLRDIAFAVSRDEGRTFEAPVRISEDKWELNGCPDDGPAMAVDASGEIHVVWPSLVQGAQPRGALFYASSRDGRTFSARVEVPTLGSVKPSHPQIAIDGRGRVLLAWDEQQGQRRVSAAREIVRRDDGASFGEIVRLSEGDAAYYPAIAAAGDRFVAVWSEAGEATSIGVRAFTLR